MRHKKLCCEGHKGEPGVRGIPAIDRPAKVGFVASCFDLLHAGHCLMLEDAKKQCDHLIAALHVDPSIERSHKNEPIQSLEERLIQLESIKYVDEVHVYETEEQLIFLLKKLRPNVRVLGSDYFGENFSGKNLGADVYYHVRDDRWSTSQLRERIENASR